MSAIFSYDSKTPPRILDYDLTGDQNNARWANKALVIYDTQAGVDQATQLTNTVATHYLTVHEGAVVEMTADEKAVIDAEETHAALLEQSRAMDRFPLKFLSWAKSFGTIPVQVGTTIRSGVDIYYAFTVGDFFESGRETLRRGDSISVRRVGIYDVEIVLDANGRLTIQNKFGTLPAAAFLTLIYA